VNYDDRSAGRGHARRQLAERASTEEAIEAVRPLADTGYDIDQLWLGLELAERDHLDELRQRAGTGSYHALHELAGWLADRGRLDEVREFVVDQRPLLSS
jgi:hypothetical protein